MIHHWRSAVVRGLAVVVAVVVAVVLAAAPAGLAEWTFTTPEQQGMDSAPLEQLREMIDAAELPIDSLVVLRHGAIVFEHHPELPFGGPEIPHNLYSTTKSITSLLIGIAIEQGFIDGVHQPVVDLLPDREILNLDERKRRMTLEHLLAMTSGLAWQGPDDMYHTWGAAIQSGDPVQYTLDRPMASEPGATWYYNGGCSHLLSAILTEATGMSTLAFAREVLFDPLGIGWVIWPRDPHGIYYGGQDIRLSPHAMAKIGQLVLDEGVWQGEQVVPAAWIAASRETRTDLGAGGYGYQWWTYPASGIFYASGAFEQRIFVVPALDLVAVFTADNQAPGIGPGERAEGPPIVEWLFSRFILPACDDYTPLPYVGFGFSIATPHLVHSRTLGGPGATHASDAAGLALFSYSGSPYEQLGVRWTTPDGPHDPAAALAELARCFVAFGLQVNDVGPLLEVETARGDAICQRLYVTDETGPLIIYSGTLTASEDGRSIVVYTGIARQFAAWIDPLAELTRLLASLQVPPGT